MRKSDPIDDLALFPMENPNPVFRVAPDGLILFANLASDDLLASWGTRVGSRLPAEWQQRVADALSSGARQRVSVLCGKRMLELDLVPIPVRAYVNVYGRDVTEQEAAKQAREALLAELAEQEERARDLIRYAPTGIYEVDFRTGCFRTVNDAMCEILGYTRDELLAMSAFDLLDDAGKAVFAERIRRTLAGEQVDPSVEYRVAKKDGSVIYGVLSTRITCDNGRPCGALVIAHDVTERRRAAEDLARQREQLRAANSRLQTLAERLADNERFLTSILENTPAHIAYLDENLVYRQCNQAAAAEMGQPVEAILGRHLRELNPDNPQIWEAVEGVLRTGQPFISEELAVTWPDRPEEGTQYYTVAYLPDKDASGRVRGVFAEGQRVTALVEARQQLQEARDNLEKRVQERTAELEAIFASLPDAIYVGDENGIKHCNDIALLNLGCESIEELWDKIPVLAEKVQTRSAETGLRIPPDREPFVRALQGEPVTQEMVLRNLKTGRDMVVRSACAPIWLGGAVKGAVAVNTDITERKKSEEELKASQEQLKSLSHRLVERQESERRLVANELYDDEGQRLAALLLELSVMEKEVKGNPALLGRVDRMKRLASGVLSDMHSLAVNLRPASLDRLGLIPALRTFAEELGSQYNLSIQVETNELEKGSLPPDAETTLYRIAQEALMNAVHHAHAGRISIVATQHGSRLVLVIDDDGQGFDVAEATRRGGLGIIGMRERAEMLGGKLTVQSTPGRGTTVFIEAPVVATKQLHTPVRQGES